MDEPRREGDIKCPSLSLTLFPLLSSMINSSRCSVVTGLEEDWMGTSGYRVETCINLPLVKMGMVQCGIKFCWPILGLVS